MDDKKFQLFENWYLKRKKEWAKKGIFVENSMLSEFGHQYWIKIYSQNGLGNIPFDKEDDIVLYEKELIEYMIL